MGPISKVFIIIIFLFLAFFLVLFGISKQPKQTPKPTPTISPTPTLTPTPAIVAPIPQRNIVRPNTEPTAGQSAQPNNTTIINNQPVQQQPAPQPQPTAMPQPTQAPEPTRPPLICALGICL